MGSYKSWKVQEKCFGFQRESTQQEGIGEGSRKEVTSEILKDQLDVPSEGKIERAGRVE